MLSRSPSLLLILTLTLTILYWQPNHHLNSNLKLYSNSSEILSSLLNSHNRHLKEDYCGSTDDLVSKSAFHFHNRHQLLHFQTPLDPNKTPASVDDQDFCPPAGPGRRATAILVPLDQGAERWDSEDSGSRTSFVGHHDGGADAKKSPIGFLPFHPVSSNDHLPPRLESNMTTAKGPCPVYYVPASPLFSPVPPLRHSSSRPNSFPVPPSEMLSRLGRLRNPFDHFNSRAASLCGQKGYSKEELALWKRRGYSEFMFGFATTPTRALDFIPRWAEWLPSALPPHEKHTHHLHPLRRPTASALVLIPPKEELDQAWEVESAARGAGFDIFLREFVADRFERRYMSLVQEMWKHAQERERLGGVAIQWFTLADDDTYFLSLDSVARMLSKYNPLEPHFVGGQSESENARRDFGNIAFGGAGIFLSRGLMELINKPGAFDTCVSLFSNEFGGDGMITKCAAMMMHRAVQEVVTPEKTLHQLDIRDEGHGVFQAGWRFTSIHHWKSWFQLQPRSHPHTIKDPSKLASLLGNAARAVGPENWTRRYVWGLPENAKVGAEDQASVVLSLGYSITVHARGILHRADLDKVEMTFAPSKITSVTRPALLESQQRRTYYLVDLKTGSSTDHFDQLNPISDVAVMTHVNHEGDLIDLVWDARPRSRSRKAV